MLFVFGFLMSAIGAVMLRLQNNPMDEDKYSLVDKFGAAFFYAGAVCMLLSLSIFLSGVLP